MVVAPRRMRALGRHDGREMSTGCWVAFGCGPAGLQRRPAVSRVRPAAVTAVGRAAEVEFTSDAVERGPSSRRPPRVRAARGRRLVTKSRHCLRLVGCGRCPRIASGVGVVEAMRNRQAQCSPIWRSKHGNLVEALMTRHQVVTLAGHRPAGLQKPSRLFRGEVLFIPGCRHSRA